MSSNMSSGVLSNLLNCMLCFRRPKLDTIEGTYRRDGKEPLNSEQSVSSLDICDVCSNQDEKRVEAQSKVNPKVNRALVVAGKGRYEILESHQFPSLDHESEVIIRTRAVGLNPIDYKSVDFNFCLPEFPWITGREMAGIVEKVGSDVKNLKVGQRVWTSTYYRDRRAGCFQQYVTVPQHTVESIPGNLSFEEASCLGVAGLTAVMTLWKWLQVPGSPATETHTISDAGYILIWGGSTITAQFAIQIAVLGGIKVIAVTSSKTKALAERLGATHIIARDGKTGDKIVSEIRAVGGDEIIRGLDLVGSETASLCLKALSTSKKALFAPLAMMSSKVIVPQNISVQMVEMKQFVLDTTSQIYALALNELVEERKIALPEITVLDGGFEIIEEGLKRLKMGDMAGKKVVVRIP